MEGDLVLVLKHQLARNEWPVGWVVTIQEGTDGLVQLARVKVRGGELTRPNSKLCVLEEVAHAQQETSEHPEHPERPEKSRIRALDT